MDGAPGYPDGELRQHYEGAEQVPQPLEEAVEAVTLVPRERTAEQIGDAPQFREETVDEELSVPRERVQQGTAEQIGDVPQLLARPPGVAEQPEKATSCRCNNRRKVCRCCSAT